MSNDQTAPDTTGQTGNIGQSGDLDQDSQASASDIKHDDNTPIITF